MAVNEPYSFKSVVDTVAQTTLARQVFRCVPPIFVCVSICLVLTIRRRYSLYYISRSCLLSLSRIDEPVLRAHVATVVEGAAGRQIDIKHGRQLSRGQRAYNSTAMGGSSSAAPAAPRQPSKVL
jgi:hypothetical protein